MLPAVKSEELWGWSMTDCGNVEWLRIVLQGAVQSKMYKENSNNMLCPTCSIQTRVGGQVFSVEDRGLKKIKHSPAHSWQPAELLKNCYANRFVKWLKNIGSKSKYLKIQCRHDTELGKDIRPLHPNPTLIDFSNSLQWFVFTSFRLIVVRIHTSSISRRANGIRASTF